MSTGQKCEQCRKAIRRNSKRAERLFLRSNGREAWVCGPRCLSAYNEGEDMAKFGGGGHTVGEKLDDGRYVVQVDEKGRIEVVSRTAPAGVVEAPEPDLLECQDEPEQEEQEATGDDVDDADDVDVEEAEEIVPEPAQEPTEPKKKRAYHRKTKEETKKTKTTKKTTVKKAPKKSAKTGRKRMKWTPEIKAKYKAQIANGKATYTSIAKDLGISVPAVWIPLNK